MRSNFIFNPHVRAMIHQYLNWNKERWKKHVSIYIRGSSLNGIVTEAALSDSMFKIKNVLA